MGRIIRRVPLDFATIHPVGIVWPGYLLPYGQRYDPPTGDGWQIWETTTEGSPITNVCETPEELAQWATDHRVSIFAEDTMSADEWLNFIRANEAAWPSPGTAARAVMDGVNRDPMNDPQDGDTKPVIRVFNPGDRVMTTRALVYGGGQLVIPAGTCGTVSEFYASIGKYGVYRVHTYAGKNLGMPARDLTPVIAIPSPADRIAAALAEIAAAQLELAADTARTAEDARLRPVPGDVRVGRAGDYWTCTRSTDWAAEFKDADGHISAWPLNWWDLNGATFIPAHLATKDTSTDG